MTQDVVIISLSVEQWRDPSNTLAHFNGTLHSAAGHTDDQPPSAIRYWSTQCFS